MMSFNLLDYREERLERFSFFYFKFRGRGIFMRLFREMEIYFLVF